MSIFKFLLKKQESIINLPFFGKVSYNDSNQARYIQDMYYDEYILDDDVVQIELTLTKIDNKTEKIVSDLLNGLVEIHDKCKLAFLQDFNNEDSIGYTDRIFERIFSSDEFNSIINTMSREQRLLSALNIYSIQICQLEEGFDVVFNYIYGHEIAIQFHANETKKLLTSDVKAGRISISSKQHSDWLASFNNLDTIEICSRFFGENWFLEHTVASYYIYRIAKNIKSRVNI